MSSLLPAPNNSLQSFEKTEFANCHFAKKPAIYILTYSNSNNDKIDYPFYVGESAELSVRFSKGDYLGSSQIKDPQGFRIKEVIKYLKERGLTINVLYKYVTEFSGKGNRKRGELERGIMDGLLKEGLVLINRKMGFTVGKELTTEEVKQLELTKRAEIRTFCDQNYSKDYVNVT